MKWYVYYTIDQEQKWNHQHQQLSTDCTAGPFSIETAEKFCVALAGHALVVHLRVLRKETEPEAGTVQ